MDITISPRRLYGEVDVIPSKSQAHRLLICSAFADGDTELICSETNRDIEATADCLRALGAKIKRTISGYLISPTHSIPRNAVFYCAESGSTLRFMLPIVGALGIDAMFHLEGRLPNRPLSPMWEEMERMGCILSRPTATSISCKGKLNSGRFYIDGSVSSQFITGLLFALSLLPGKSELFITGSVASKPYIELTKNAMRQFSVDPDCLGNAVFHTPGKCLVEGDWSNAAFFAAANKLGSQIILKGLNTTSSQGDRAVLSCLDRLGEGFSEIDAADIPDLVPILAVFAAASRGGRFLNISRLRLKESDRVSSVCNMLTSLGCSCIADENTMTICPSSFSGGIVDACNDHRIAMAASIAATKASDSVTILNAECVNKSYPNFWNIYAKLGGIYEQHIR